MIMYEQTGRPSCRITGELNVMLFLMLCLHNIFYGYLAAQEYFEHVIEVHCCHSWINDVTTLKCVMIASYT